MTLEPAIVAVAAALGRLSPTAGPAPPPGPRFNSAARSYTRRRVTAPGVGKGTLRWAGEAAYACVPKTVGIGGVSKVYGEKDLGGFSVVGKLILGFSGRK